MQRAIILMIEKKSINEEYCTKFIKYEIPHSNNPLNPLPDRFGRMVSLGCRSLLVVVETGP